MCVVLCFVVLCCVVLCCAVLCCVVCVCLNVSYENNLEEGGEGLLLRVGLLIQI